MANEIAASLTQATNLLSQRIEAHEQAKEQHRVAQRALGIATNALDTALAAEVEAHNKLQEAMNSRRKTR